MRAGLLMSGVYATRASSLFSGSSPGSSSFASLHFFGLDIAGRPVTLDQQSSRYRLGIVLSFSHLFLYELHGALTLMRAPWAAAKRITLRLNSCLRSVLVMT